MDEIVACNPGVDRAKLLRGADFDADGNLQNWFVTSTPVHTYAVDLSLCVPLSACCMYMSLVALAYMTSDSYLTHLFDPSEYCPPLYTFSPC